VAAAGLPSTSGVTKGARLGVDASSGNAAWQASEGRIFPTSTPAFYSLPDTLDSTDTTSTFALAATQLYLFPLSTPMSAAYLALQVTTAAATGKARVGLYNSASDGSPGALIEEPTATTQIDCSTTGLKEVAFSAARTWSGRVWLAVETNVPGISMRAGIPAQTAMRFGARQSGAGELGAGANRSVIITGYQYGIGSFTPTLPATLAGAGLSSQGGISPLLAVR
jgi:hypothetical protein